MFFSGHKMILFAKGGGGGGGGSGKVDYPDHMKTFHASWLDHNGADTITDSMTDVINAALGNSPWTSKSAYDPDTPISEMLDSAVDMQDLVDLLSSGNTLDSVISDVLSDSRIDDAVDEFAADLDSRLNSETLPRFEAGMRDINMVVSSAFAIGKAIIESNQDRQVSKYSADLHYKAFSDDALRLIALKLEYQKIASQIYIEANRIKIVAKKEQIEYDDKVDELDALWDISLFQYGANLLASIGGGVATPTSNKPSTVQSALGGALSGAAAGAMISSGNPIGIAAGALIGAASALF